MSHPPVVSSEGGAWPGALVRRWRDVAPDIDQPALTQLYLTVHLGGGKRVRREGEGQVRDEVMAAGMVSIIPAGAAYRWTTRGPIDFAHVYVSPQTIVAAAAAEFDREARTIEDRFGIEDPVLRSLALAMVDEVATGGKGSRVYLDALFHALTLCLVRRHSGATGPVARHSLAPARLRRVREFIEFNLATDIGLADLAAVAAHSPWHFNRAFADATGQPPYRYLIGRRVARAETMLAAGEKSIAAVALACGFNTVGQFTRMFRQVTGRSPSRYRRDASAQTGWDQPFLP